MKNIIIYFMAVSAVSLLLCTDILNTGDVGPKPPAPVTLFAPGKMYPSAVVIDWSKATSKNFSVYSLYYDTIPDVTDSSILGATIICKTDTSILLSGLDHNTNYYVKIFVYNSSSSSESNEITFTTAVCTCGVFTGKKQNGMVLIPAGCFIGKDLSIATITHDFYIDTTEVTKAEWDHIMGADTITSTKPRTEVSWFKMILYCNKKSKRLGRDTCYTYTSIYLDTNSGRINDLIDLQCHFTKNGIRLPTEDEWEYAYRTGRSEEFYWGKDGNTSPEYPYGTSYPSCREDSIEISEYALWQYNNDLDAAKEVAQRKPSAWYLYDIAGNVQEFVWDISSEKERERSRIDYTGPKKVPQGRTGRIVRGGRYDFGPRHLTAWWRNSNVQPDYNFKRTVGFRTVCTAVP